MKLALSIITILCLSINSIACSCGPKGELTKKDVEETNVIFTGKAIKVEMDEKTNSKKITFAVNTVLKGSKTTKEYVIYTSMSSASCGLSVKEGEQWLIFANSSSNETLRSGMCSRSTKVSKTIMDKKTVSKVIRKAEKKNFKLKRKQLKLDLKFIKNVLAL